MAGIAQLIAITHPITSKFTAWTHNVLAAEKSVNGNGYLCDASGYDNTSATDKGGFFELKVSSISGDTYLFEARQGNGYVDDSTIGTFGIDGSEVSNEKLFVSPDIYRFVDIYATEGYITENGAIAVSASVGRRT